MGFSHLAPIFFERYILQQKPQAREYRGKEHMNRGCERRGRILSLCLLLFLSLTAHSAATISLRLVKSPDTISVYFHDDCGEIVKYTLMQGVQSNLSDLTQVAELGTSPFEIPLENGTPFFCSVQGRLKVDITPDSPLLCQGNSLQLDAGAGYDAYLWSPGGETTRKILVSPSETTTYSVQVRRSCATGAAEETVTVARPEAPDIQPDNPVVCQGYTVVLDAGPGFLSYRWCPGGETTRCITAAPQATTQYRVEVTSACGTFEASETVHVLAGRDASPPSVDSITLNDIPDYINGNGTAGGLLSVPPFGFQFGEIVITDRETGVDPRTLTIQLDTPIGGGRPNGGYNAGDNIASLFSFEAGNPSRASFVVPQSLYLMPGGPYTIYVAAKDYCGNQSTAEAMYFRVDEKTDDRRPFGISDKIYLDFTRDIWEIRSVLSPQDEIEIDMNADPDGNGADFDAGNGIPDFVEDLWVAGLGVDPRTFAPPIVPNTGGLNSNEVVLNRVIERIRDMLEQYFPSVPISFHIEAAPPFPSTSSPVVARSADTFSVLCFGGSNNFSSPVGDSVENGITGSNFFDPHNKHDEFCCAHPYSRPSNPLTTGIYTSNILHHAINGQPSDPFRYTFDKLIELRGGTPVGKSPLDTVILDPQFDRANASAEALERYTLVTGGIEIFARLTAYVAAHELGHGLGAAADDAAPTGLYGGMAEFGNTPHHHSFEQYPPYDEFSNIMRSYTTENLSLDSRARFCEICTGYFKEMNLYLGDN
jgi:hypothetical protein